MREGKKLLTEMTKIRQVMINRSIFLSYQLLLVFFPIVITIDLAKSVAKSHDVTATKY